MARKLTGRLPSDALSELKQQGEPKYDPPAPPIFSEPKPPPPDPGFRYEPVTDWFAEMAEREREAEAEPPPATDPEPEPYPAKPKQKATRTPRLDKVRAMLGKGAP